MWLSRVSGRPISVLRDPESGAFLLLSLLVGVAVGVGAAMLIWTSEAVELGFDWVHRTMAGDVSWFAIVSVPLGLTVAWWLANRFAPEVAGDGVPEVRAGLAIRGGYLSTKSIPLKILATALTLGGGGSAGREGPIVQIGGAIGSSISRRFGLDEDQVRSLLAAGAAAGVGASFNAPIAGMLFGLEVILGSFAIRHLSSVVLASIAAAVTLRSLVPGEEILSGAESTMRDPRELILYAGLAVVAVIAAVLFLRVLDVAERRAHRMSLPMWTRPLILGLMVGGIGIFEPRLLGTGQDFVSELLVVEQMSTQLGVEGFAVSVLALLVLGKIIATSLTLASGGSGGAFMPSLFIGATLGAAYAELVQPLWGSPLSASAYAVVGMATVFAAVARAPLTAILIVFEVTGAAEYGLILPLMLSAVFATFVADRIHPQSVYTMALERRGIHLVSSSEVDLMDTVTVGDVVTMPPLVVTSDMAIVDVHAAMNRYRYHGLPVVDGDELVGIVTVTDIVRAGGSDATGVVADVMTRRPATVNPDTPVSEALERMAFLGVGRLPVVSGRRLVGLFRREDAVKAYHQALGDSTSHSMARARLRQRSAPGASYYDFRIPPGSMADSVRVRDVAWPEGSTLVSVLRGTTVLVPVGATELKAGDIVTAFGTDESRRVMIERMNAGADEPTAEIMLEEIESSGEPVPGADQQPGEQPVDTEEIR